MKEPAGAMFTNKTTSLAVLAAGTTIQVVRDANVGNVGKIPTRLSNRLVYAGAEKYLADLEQHDGITAVVVPSAIADKVPPRFGLAVSEDPHAGAMQLFEKLIAIPGLQWEDFPSRIAESAQIHPTAVIASRNVIIGERTHIDAGTVIRERSIIGDDCYIGALSVIGAEAFEMMPSVRPKRLLKQAGGVRMANQSTVLSATMVVRATFGGFTEIREGACIDNLVHLAHDVDVGANSSIIACAEVSGRVVLGEDSYIGPNATISNGLTIGRGATLSLGSVATRDIADDVTMTGNFAVPHSQWMRFVKWVAGAK
jgi:UDP-3-O-[3-hydroxymyristoyl] glucosamine N-acyltransferase